MQVHLLRLERLYPETGKKTWRKINRLSFARFLVHKIIKREVDGEINFTNPFYKKLGTRKFLLAASRKMGYKVNLRIDEGKQNCTVLIDLSSESSDNGRLNKQAIKVRQL